MSLQVLSATLVTLVSAVPANNYPGAPAGFNPYKKYPAPANYTPHNITGQGVHYNHIKAVADKIKAALSPEDQPQWGIGSYVDNPTALAWYNSDFTAGTSGVSPTSYTCFGGNVNVLPPISQWMNFYAVRCLLNDCMMFS